MSTIKDKENQNNGSDLKDESTPKTQVNLDRPHLPFFKALFSFHFGGMSIIHRLYLCVGLTFFLFLVATLVVVYMTNQVNGSHDRSGVRSVVRTSNLVGNDILSIEESIRLLFVQNADENLAISELKSAVGSMDKNLSALNEQINKLSDETVKSTLNNKYYDKARSLVSQLSQSANTIANVYHADRQRAVKLAYDQTSLYSMPALYQLRNLVTYLNNRNLADQAIVDKMMRYVEYCLFIGLGIALCVIVLTNITIRHSLRRDTGVLLRRLQSMAQGDLRDKVELKAQDEIGSIGRLVDHVVANTNGTLTVVKNDVEKLYDMVHTNLRTINATNEAISLQRNTAQSVASATSEMEIAVEKVTEFAKSTLEEVKSAEEASDTCRRTMQDNITTTHTLSDRLRASSEAINKIHMMSSQIKAIVKTIADIADQTNL